MQKGASFNLAAVKEELDKKMAARWRGCRRYGPGKILRGTMKRIADGDQWTMPATIDDPAILGEIGSA